MDLKKPAKITAKEIGRIVGCCQQAVSSVLSGRGNSKVSREKRERILEAARSFNYRPNPSALRLAGRPTRTIGIIPESSVFCAEILAKLSTSLRVLGYQSIVFPLIMNHEDEMVMDSMFHYGVDGIISLNNKSGNFEHDRLKIPGVLISYDNYDIDFDWRHGFGESVRHLIGHGHSRIGFILDAWSYSLTKMREGYEAEMIGNGLSCPEDWTVELLWNADFGRKLAGLIETEKVTAFLCSSDIIAGRLMVYLKQHGWRVPDDVAVIGFYGTSFDEVMTTSLTSIVYPIGEICRNAAEMIVAKVENKELARTAKPLDIRSRLHLGHSCGCPEREMKIVWWEGVPVSVEKMHCYRKPPPEGWLD
jgi:DNA-binding LacI/PurR family transcriptional regulator